MQTKYAIIIGAGLLTGGVAVSTPVTAMTLPGSAGIVAAADSASVTEDAAYVCRRWRGRYRWHRRCWWAGPSYYTTIPAGTVGVGGAGGGNRKAAARSSRCTCSARAASAGIL